MLLKKSPRTSSYQTQRALPIQVIQVLLLLTIAEEKISSFIEGLKKEEQTLFYQPIKKSKITFFKQEEISSVASSKENILKEVCHLFSQLFISCQIRQCDLHEFFQHENQTAPASLSGSGKLRTCQKSQLGEILESNALMPNTKPEADAIIIVNQLLSTPSPHLGQRHGMSVKRSRPTSPNSVSA